MGAHYGSLQDQPAFWAPMSLRQRKDGTTAVFPHFVFDRSKPGTVCVDLTGKRFVNETVSYHEFGKAMLNGGPSTEKAWIITDSIGLQKYGLGMVRLGGDNPEPYIRDGYLKHGDTLADLAHSISVDPDELSHSVQSINDAAQQAMTRYLVEAPMHINVLMAIQSIHLTLRLAALLRHLTTRFKSNQQTLAQHKD